MCPHAARFFQPDLHGEATTRGVNQLIKDTRAHGYASVEGRFILGLVAAAAPMLDWQQEAQAVVTLISTDPRDIEAQSVPFKKTSELLR